MDYNSLLGTADRLRRDVQALAEGAGKYRVWCALKQSERLVLSLRTAYERQEFSYQKEKPTAPSPPMPLSGSVFLNEHGWLHIELNCLLPHCRYSCANYLSDTLARLLRECSEHYTLPYFQHAFVVIEEYSNIRSRQVFDHDNKGWRAIPNVLKGVVIEDDDQYSMDLVLLARKSEEVACHIFVLDAAEASEFFIWKAEQDGASR